MLDALGLVNDRNNEQICSDVFPTVTSPMRPYSNLPFFSSADQESHMGFYQADNSEHDSVNEFLKSVLIMEDEHSEGSKVQQTSTTLEVIHDRLGSEINNEVGILQVNYAHYVSQISIKESWINRLEC